MADSSQVEPGGSVLKMIELQGSITRLKKLVGRAIEPNLFTPSLLQAYFISRTIQTEASGVLPVKLK